MITQETLDRETILILEAALTGRHDRDEFQRLYDTYPCADTRMALSVIVASTYWMVAMLRDVPHGELALGELLDKLKDRARQ